MTRLTTRQARQNLSETLKRVASKGERIVLQSRGKDLAAVVPLEDLKLLEDLEDQLDLEEARKALAEPGESVSWEKIKADLKL